MLKYIAKRLVMAAQDNYNIDGTKKTLKQKFKERKSLNEQERNERAA